MPPVELPSSADCVVVGGGAVGCSLAYHLARGGMRPLLLERGELGGGSTGKCAGGVRQQFSTAVNVRVGRMSRAMLEDFEEEVGAPADLRQIGYLLLATSEEEASRFAANVAVQRAAGLDDVEVLEPQQAAELVPELRVDDVVSATFCPSDGLAGPNEVTAGYAVAARRHGATIVEGCEVTAIARDHERVVGVGVGNGAERRRVASPMVVDCAGPHARAVGRLAGVAVPVTPYRRHLFITERLPMRSSTPMTVDLRTSFYFHPEGDGLLLGMSDASEPPGFDTSVSFEFLGRLIETAIHRLPILEKAAIRTGWAGLYEVSPDNQAIVGPADELEGFWLCCGFSGHGFMQAPAIGRLLAQRILGEEPAIDLGPYSPARFAQGAALEAEAAVI